MNVKEIFVLNTALDSKQIFYLPDFEKLHMSNLLIDDVIQLLVEKGLLENAEELTMEGVKIVKRMEDFKNADKYVKLGNLVIGMKDAQEGVALKYIPTKEDYSFERIDLTKNVESIVEAFPFMKEAFNTPENDEPVNLTLEQLMRQYHLGVDNCIYISTMDIKDAKEVDDVTITNELIFANEGNLYLYDRETELLFKKGNDEILVLLGERMTA